MNKQKLFYNFIKKHNLAVLSTVGVDNKPESAVIEFAETEELELIFDTFTHFRKYKNLVENKNISVVIGWDDNVTIQYEGVAQELQENELKDAKKLYFQKNPDAKKWENEDGIVYFKVVPKWIRYTNLNKKPWEVIEENF